MAAPIGGGNYTPQEINELNRIWSNLPTADNTTFNADINELKKLAAAHPNGSLPFIIASIQESAGNQEMLQYADLGIAQELYPNLPNIMPSDMAQQLKELAQKFTANPYNTPTTTLAQYLNQLNGLLAEAQNMQPPSPQSTLIVNTIQQAINEVGSAMTGMPGPGGLSSVVGAIQYLLPPGAAT